MFAGKPVGKADRGVNEPEGHTAVGHQQRDTRETKNKRENHQCQFGICTADRDGTKLFAMIFLIQEHTNEHTQQDTISTLERQKDYPKEKIKPLWPMVARIKFVVTLFPI